MKLGRIIKLLLLVIFGALGLLIAFIVLAITISDYHGSRNTNYLKAQFQKVEDKTNASITSTQCISSNIDTPDYCYFVLSSSDTAKSIESLTNNLVNQGYSVTTANLTDSDSEHNKHAANSTSLDTHFYYLESNGQIQVFVSRASNPYY